MERRTKTSISDPYCCIILHFSIYLFMVVVGIHLSSNLLCHQKIHWLNTGLLINASFLPKFPFHRQLNDSSCCLSVSQYSKTKNQLNKLKQLKVNIPLIGSWSISSIILLALRSKYSDLNNNRKICNSRHFT